MDCARELNRGRCAYMWIPEKGRLSSEDRERWIVQESWIEGDALACGCPHSNIRHKMLHVAGFIHSAKLI